MFFLQAAATASLALLTTVEASFWACTVQISWLSPGDPDFPISLLPMAERFHLLCRAQRSRCLARVSSLENDGAKLVMLANTHV